ncbi:hypothetical protein GCM10012283_11920 [Phycicoccus endophyticus]|nr:murein L,D-transpeptidase [Phycicoccus endophyticus]GGL31214.1 hypothetical protein GCM10012283_11920 [Phycicoccus endophyticus]
MRRVAPLAVLALAGAVALGGCGRLERAGEGGVLGEPDASAGPWSSRPATPTAGTSSPSTSPALSPSPTLIPTTTPTPASSPTSSASPTPTTTAGPTPSAGASPAPSPTRTAPLRYGDEGPRVRTLQRRLRRLGYWLGAVDGHFGGLTQQAVFALQKAAGIARDGVVGPDTRRALDRGVRPQATLTGDGVEIDLERQLLLVVRDGSTTLAFNTSTGSGEPYTSTSGRPAIAHTPTGSYTVFREVDGQDDSELGQLWRPKYFNGGYAVHGSPSIPPYPASHGCARLSTSAMDMIWTTGLMPIGSRVLVR